MDRSPTSSSPPAADDQRETIREDAPRRAARDAPWPGIEDYRETESHRADEVRRIRDEVQRDRDAAQSEANDPAADPAGREEDLDTQPALVPIGLDDTRPMTRPTEIAPGVDPAKSTRAERVAPVPTEAEFEEANLAEPGLDLAIDVLSRLRARVRAQVIGRDDVVDLVLVALLADGHVLLEDFPGSGKTTLAKSLGQSIVEGIEQVEVAPFRRIQFTPDLLPSDVTGVSIFDAQSQRFYFRRGPIFAHVVLADEINRTSPKVQAAMLEAMAEKQVTVDNVTYRLDDLFFVIATQNPLDLAGTYPLPVAQLDRFLFKIRMEHIDRQAELEVLETFRTRRDTRRTDLRKVSRAEVLAARQAIDRHVHLDERIRHALVDLAQALRNDERVLQGCSTRSLVVMLPALAALAALRGRDYVNADDVEHLAPRVLGHRLELAPGAGEAEDVLTDALGDAVEELARSTLRR
ncbi:MAG: AAA family ATPase [Acidobacteriota bacterium]